MTQPKHTPGPWHRNIHPRYPIYSGQRNQKVAAALYGERTGVSEAEALANCDLIAASPDLLAVARECLDAERHRRADLLPGAPATTYSDARIARIEAAIRKAEGTGNG